MITQFKLFELTSTSVEVELGDRIKVMDPFKNSKRGFGDFIDCIVLSYPTKIEPFPDHEPPVTIWTVDVADLDTKEHAVAFFHPEKKAWAIKEWKDKFRLQRNSAHYENSHTERYWLHYIEMNCVGQKYGNSIDALKHFAASNPNIKVWEIFKNVPNLNSSESDHLICWFDEDQQNYWANMSRKYPELKAKEIFDPVNRSTSRFDL